MNERIRELMIKAIYDVDRIYDPIDNPLNEEVSKMYIPDCFAEKFAELILAECIDIAEQTRFEGKVVAERIKFVFGVDQQDK